MSARRGVEQAKSATAAQTSLRVKIQRGTALGNDDGMQAVWRQGGGKPIAREGCQYRYPGSRTSSVGELAMQTRAVFLFSMRGQFRYESRGRIWCGLPREPTGQHGDKKQLNGAQPRKYIGVRRATGDGVGAFHMTKCRERRARGLLVTFCRSLPPASEREARMDDPTRWCENDASNGTRLPGLPVPSGGPTFLSHRSDSYPRKLPI